MLALKKMSRTIVESLKQIGQYLSGAMSRIFGPTDDQYPESGVQPFEGDIPDS